MTSTERVALIVYLLSQGAEMTSQEVARRTGLTTGSGLRLLQRVSRVIPLCETDGVWQMMDAPRGARDARGRE